METPVNSGVYLAFSAQDSYNNPKHTKGVDDMSHILKRDALLATVRAFLDRESYIQYDQRSMDRVLQLTARPRRYYPPEAATQSHTVYMDCSNYMNALYYHTFGQELESGLTWHMIDMVTPRIFFYTLTHQETEAELAALEANIRQLLQPGDVITFDRNAGSGHTMMYIGEDRFTDCSPDGRPDSYDYKNRKSNEYPDGGLYVKPLSDLFKRENEPNNTRSLILSNRKRIAISRPLDRMGAPTENALLRLGPAKGLVCGVECSHSGGRHAIPGQQITYRVWVRNKNAEDVTARVTFKAPAGTRLLSCSDGDITIPQGSQAEAVYTVTVETAAGLWLEGPAVTVNGLRVYTHRVLLGSKLPHGTAADLTPEQALAHFNRLFWLHDSTGGDVLYRRSQDPRRDMAVYGLFGGYGVVTPELATDYGIRCTAIHRSDLMPGDVILWGEDPYGKTLSTTLYTGSRLVGPVEAGEEQKTLEGEEIDRFIDSLFGRFFFVVLRPSLKE